MSWGNTSASTHYKLHDDWQLNYEGTVDNMLLFGKGKRVINRF